MSSQNCVGIIYIAGGLALAVFSVKNVKKVQFKSFQLKNTKAQVSSSENGLLLDKDCQNVLLLVKNDWWKIMRMELLFIRMELLLRLKLENVKNVTFIKI